MDLVAILTCPTRLSGFSSSVAPLLRSHLFRSRLATLEATLTTESDSGGVFPFVGIERRCFSCCLVHDLPSKLVRIARALT